jgi:DNA modification methylase
VTDPPYGIDYQSNRRKVKDKFAKLAADNEEEMQILIVKFYQQAWRILKPGSHLYCFCRWDVWNSFFEGAQEQGFKVKNCLVWVKDNHGSGDLFGSYAPRHEFCLFCVKPGEHVRLLRGKRTSDALFYKKVPSSRLLHPTQKPLRMVAHFIEKSSEPGDVVLDPFSGSGVICKAASILGRRYIGIDVNQEMVTTAKENLGNVE